MKKFKISINAINSVYEANSKKEALEVYARDAGYDSYGSLKDQFPFDEVDKNNNESVTEIIFDLTDELWSVTHKSYNEFFNLAPSTKSDIDIEGVWYNLETNVELALLDNGEWWSNSGGVRIEEDESLINQGGA